MTHNLSMHVPMSPWEGNPFPKEMAIVSPQPRCQYCGASLHVTWANLGLQPLANDYCTDQRSAEREPLFPLHARFCRDCYLVQVASAVPREAIFNDYAYFSSYSESWLDHCARYAQSMIERFGLGPSSRVVEVASNDGYLLQYFASAGVKVLGIDPAENVARVAKAAGIPTEIAFFGAATALDMVRRGIKADHVSAKNVLAHVPDIADFVRGISIILKDDAVFTVEFPHLLRTMAGLQFDQIYHEHFSYLSLIAVRRIFEDHGLRIFDVDELATHGGSLRVYACHRGAAHVDTARVADVVRAERSASLDQDSAYLGFEWKLNRVRQDFLDFTASVRASSQTLIGYGAAAKANTFLNYCGASSKTLPCIADRSSSKVGRFMPGSGIPIVGVDEIAAIRPDFVLILPWNLKAEIVQQLQFIRSWGGRFVTAVPSILID